MALGRPLPIAYDVKDVAELLKISRATVYRHAETGKLPCFRIGQLLRFDPEEVQKLMRLCVKKAG